MSTTFFIAPVKASEAYFIAQNQGKFIKGYVIDLNDYKKSLLKQWTTAQIQEFGIGSKDYPLEWYCLQQDITLLD